jgi:hypothetical protein
MTYTYTFSLFFFFLKIDAWVYGAVDPSSGSAVMVCLNSPFFIITC